MADNPKGELIAALAAQGMSPEFRVEGSGPAHAPSFVAEVWCDGQRLGSGTGGSRREAERCAAQQALEELLPGEPVAGLQVTGLQVTGLQVTGLQVAGELGAGTRRRAVEQDAAGVGAGPYPLYPAVLAEALAVADHRLPQGTPLPEVAQRAAALYRRLLAELGHGARTQEAGAQESRAQESSPQTSGAGGPTAEEARDLR